MLISEPYREMNRQLHQSRPDYGANARRWAPEVRVLVEQLSIGTILDYGCGKASLWEGFERPSGWQNYDPAIPDFADAPRPADLVLSLDVLEHIEPEHLMAVLDDMAQCTQIAVLVFTATVPAKKSLPDGRNAHLIQQPIEWWAPQLMRRWAMAKMETTRGGFMFIGMAR